MQKYLLCAALAGGLGFAAPADAAGVKVGTLSCHEAGGWGFVFGSSRSIRCVFTDGKVRTLTMPGGRVVRELLTDEGPHHYTYTLERPDMKAYFSTVSVKPKGEDACRIELVVRFQPKDEGALEMVYLHTLARRPTASEDHLSVVPTIARDRLPGCYAASGRGIGCHAAR